MTDLPATIERAYRVRLRLKPDQERTLSRLLGAKRFVWNWALRRKDEAWRADGAKLNAVALSREFTTLRTQPEQGLDPSMPLPKGTRLTESNRMRRRRRQIGRLHAAVADCRRDHQHQLTARIVAAAAVLAIEDLAVKAMTRGMGRRAFHRSVSDAGLGEIRRQLTYKAAWHGRQLVAVDRFYPSSKTCSGCGEIHQTLTLRERTWTCGACGATHDRDHNAAINIEREGLRLLAEAPSTPRSGGIDARGEGACAAGKPSPTGQPTSLNRELVYRAAKPRPTRRTGKEPARRVTG